MMKKGGGGETPTRSLWEKKEGKKEKKSLFVGQRLSVRQKRGGTFGGEKAETPTGEGGRKIVTSYGL